LGVADLDDDCRGAAKRRAESGAPLADVDVLDLGENGSVAEVFLDDFTLTKARDSSLTLGILELVTVQGDTGDTSRPMGADRT
jgi:hypothetical protein